VQDELEQYTILENAIFIPISAKIGTNLDKLKKNIIDVVQKHQENEKIRRLELEKEKEKEKNRILAEKKLEINMEKERKALGGMCTAVETVKEDNIWNEYQDNNHNHSSSSNGVLLDIIKSRKLGTTLHVVIKEGEVRMALIIILSHSATNCLSQIE
jgi:translation initiation factor IF-2